MRVTYTPLSVLERGQIEKVDGGGCWDFQYARDLRAENTFLSNVRTTFKVRAIYGKSSLYKITINKIIKNITTDDYL